MTIICINSYMKTVLDEFAFFDVELQIQNI